jgi:hypothetical protein
MSFPKAIGTVDRTELAAVGFEATRGRKGGSSRTPMTKSKRGVQVHVHDVNVGGQSGASVCRFDRG